MNLLSKTIREAGFYAPHGCSAFPHLFTVLGRTLEQMASHHRYTAERPARPGTQCNSVCLTRLSAFLNAHLTEEQTLRRKRIIRQIAWGIGVRICLCLLHFARLSISLFCWFLLWKDKMDSRMCYFFCICN